jgi:hypothetical protein
MISPLFSLPQEILCSIANYLLPESSQDKRIFHYSYDLRNFMNSNKEYFGKWKKESQIIVLGDSEAKRFRDLKEFREKVCQCVENPRFQLDLVFDKEEEMFDLEPRPDLDLLSLGNVRKCHLRYYDCGAPPAMDVDEISLVDCRIEDYSCCSNVKSVTIEQSSKVSHFDFSPFQNIEKGCFKLDFLTETTNHHLLYNLKSLYLFGCQSITDVSCFQNIPHLNILCCIRITDVSSLGRVHTLNLAFCENIYDVSALGRVHTLNLFGCRNVTDVSALEWVYSLTLSGFRGADLSGLKNIVILHISGAALVTDITMLHSLQVLDIEGCGGITSLSGLPGVKELWISESGRQKITSGNEVFLQLLKLHLVGSDSPLCSEFLLTLVHVQDLSLHSYAWKDLGCISLLPELRSLTISCCRGFKSLPRLPSSLGYLKISGFKRDSLIIPLRTENSLHHSCSSNHNTPLPLYDLFIENCPVLKKLQIDEKVFKCRISSCPKLTTVIVNEQIGHLTVRKVDSLEKIVNWSKVVCPALFSNPERVLTVDPIKDEFLLSS